jgi:hypothetical protein
MSWAIYERNEREREEYKQGCYDGKNEIKRGKE